MPLHLGLILPNYGDGLEAERLAACAVAAEESGFDSGWVTDHLVVPDEHAAIYGSIAEALVSLGFLAGRTQRLQLGVSALIVPARNPLVALKQLTTLDFLSGGRVVTAVAAGWMEGEFETLGAPFASAGSSSTSGSTWQRRRSSRCPAGCASRAAASHSTAGSRRRSARRPEIWVAGVSRATLRRAAQDRRLASGRALAGRAARARPRLRGPNRPPHQHVLRRRAEGRRGRARASRDRGTAASGSPSGWPSTSRRAATGSSINLGHEAPGARRPRAPLRRRGGAAPYLNSSRRKALRNGVDSSSP